MGRDHNNKNGFCSGQADGAKNLSNHASSANLTVGLSLRVVGMIRSRLPEDSIPRKTMEHGKEQTRTEEVRA